MFDFNICNQYSHSVLDAASLKSFSRNDLISYAYGRLVRFFIVQATHDFFNQGIDLQRSTDKQLNLLDRIGIEHIDALRVAEDKVELILIVSRPGILIGPKAERYTALRDYFGPNIQLVLVELNGLASIFNSVLAAVMGNAYRRTRKQAPDVLKQMYDAARFYYDGTNSYEGISHYKELSDKHEKLQGAIPTDVYSAEFAAWLAAQQQLAFIKGCELTKEAIEEAIDQDAALAKYEQGTESQFQAMLDKQSVNQMILNEGLRAFEEDTRDEVYGDDSDTS